MKTFNSFISALKKLEYYIATPIFMIMLAIMFIQVVFRYLLHQPLPWSEESARFLFVASTFLGAAIATAERGHIEINFTEMAIEKIAKTRDGKMRGAIGMNILRDLGTILCLSLVGWQTYLLVFDQFTSKSVSTAMAFPFWIITGIMLLGFVLSILHSIGLIILNLGGYGPYGYEFAEEEECQCIS
ncbi:MAG: transporter small permease [Firmicutes bacterium]|nr:transporter small permease [Bacillota bacterium]